MAAAAWTGVLLSLAPWPDRPDRSAPAGVAATAARLDDLHRRISGTAEEWRATELLHHHRVQDGMAACLAAAGRPYRRVPLVSFYRDFTDADMGYGTGRASVLDSVTERGRRLVRNEAAYARVEATRPRVRPAPADASVHHACLSRVRRDAAPAAEAPPGAYELAELPGLGVAGDAAVAAAMSGYRPCMRQRYGHHVTDRSDFLFRPRIDRSDAPVDGRPATAAWTRGVAEIDAVFAADADCRRPAYTIAMTLAGQRLDGWERRNRPRLDAVRAAWRQRVADAAGLPRR